MAKLRSYSVYTNQGPYLQINEDDAIVDLKNKLFMIFDGFGGSNIGDKAVDLLKDTISKFYTKIGGDPDSTFPFYYSHKYLIEGNALVNSMHLAHSMLKKENSEKDLSSRGGASCIAASLADSILTFASTGNCSGYILRRGKLSRIIHPDSLEALSEDSYELQYRTTPMSGFGLFDDLHLNVLEHKVVSGDLFVLMTDGAYSRVSSDEMKDILSEKDLDDNSKIKKIVSLSNQRGNLDNQSTIFLQF
jgi:serine/threonine protein phosphatase PrpC